MPCFELNELAIHERRDDSQKEVSPRRAHPLSVVNAAVPSRRCKECLHDSTGSAHFLRIQKLMAVKTPTIAIRTNATAAPNPTR